MPGAKQMEGDELHPLYLHTRGQWLKLFLRPLSEYHMSIYLARVPRVYFSVRPILIKILFKMFQDKIISTNFMQNVKFLPACFFQKSLKIVIFCDLENLLFPVSKLPENHSSDISRQVFSPEKNRSSRSLI